MKSLRFGNKKGSVADAITVPAFILLVCMTIFVSIYVWYAFQEGMEVTAQTSPANATILTTMDNLRVAYNSIDYMLPLMVVGLLIVSLVFAFKTGANVIYAYISIFLWALAMLMSAVYTNVFDTFVTTFPTVATDMPMIVFVMDNMKWLTLFWLIVISVVMFSRNKQEEQIIKETSTGFDYNQFG